MVLGDVDGGLEEETSEGDTEESAGVRGMRKEEWAYRFRIAQ